VINYINVINKFNGTAPTCLELEAVDVCDHLGLLTSMVFTFKIYFNIIERWELMFGLIAVLGLVQALYMPLGFKILTENMLFLLNYPKPSTQNPTPSCTHFCRVLAFT
jgi:hypothetical protein